VCLISSNHCRCPYSAALVATALSARLPAGGCSLRDDLLIARHDHRLRPPAGVVVLLGSSRGFSHTLHVLTAVLGLVKPTEGAQGGYARVNSQTSTLNPQTSTPNPQPSTLYSQLPTLSHQFSNLNPQPSTISPQPSTLNSEPSTINPQPSTFNHQPSTLNHQLSNSNPNPCTLTGENLYRTYDVGP